MSGERELISEYFAAGDREITVRRDGDLNSIYVRSSAGGNHGNSQVNQFIFNKEKEYSIVLRENTVRLYESEAKP